jgi:hypothetical protein
MIVKPRLAGQKDENEIEYWIDVEAENDKPELLKLMKKYVLRK